MADRKNQGGKGEFEPPLGSKATLTFSGSKVRYGSQQTSRNNLAK